MLRKWRGDAPVAFPRKKFKHTLKKDLPEKSQQIPEKGGPGDIQEFFGTIFGGLVNSKTQYLNFFEI